MARAAQGFNAESMADGLPPNAGGAIGSRANPAPKGRAMKVRVYVSLKNGVLDPQGRAIHHSLEGLGFAGVQDVRAGRLIELEVDESVTDAQLDDMCRKLLANMVIENYRVERIAA
jgi:phosphoribosylformylglycinamidine synthase subunit PurS